MSGNRWLELVQSEGFWGGVLASILAAVILAAFSLILRKLYSAAKEESAKGKRETEAFIEALETSSPYAPFAFGVAQGRGLRLFITAALIAYVGDIFGAVLYPFHMTFYCVALIYVILALRWFYRVEERALKILGGSNADR